MDFCIPDRTVKSAQEEAKRCAVEEERARAICSPSHYEGVRQPYDNHADDDYSRPTGQERLPEVADTTSPVRNAIEQYKQTCDPIVSSGKNSNDERYNRDNFEEFMKRHREQDRDSGIGSGDNEDEMNVKESSEYMRNMPPLASAYCNPQIARNLAVENLRHRPLPDTVEDALYRSLQMKKEKYPGKILNVNPRSAAVGCKGYGVPGPTQCSKLKVYRPKTAGLLPDGTKDQAKEKDVARPKTSNSDYRSKHLSPMQLALCWDLKPPNPSDEPKRPTHIDGSNGSKAPAVFALVRPPSEEGIAFAPPNGAAPECGRKHSRDGSRSASAESASAGGRSGSGSVRQRVPRRAWGGEPKPRVVNPSAVMDIIGGGDVQLEPLLPRCQQQKYYRKSKENVPPETEQRVGSAGSSSKLSKSKQLCQSTPNLASAGGSETKTNGGESRNDSGSVTNKNRLLNNRPCMSCVTKANASPPAGRRPAVNDNDNNAACYSDGSTISTIKSQKNNGNGNNNAVQVPKPRTPYAKRSYSIDTLAPPFTVWPGTGGEGYPEHWRLASVYQHSYKPIQSRRKTFLQSVYQ